MENPATASYIALAGDAIASAALYYAYRQFKSGEIQKRVALMTAWKESCEERRSAVKIQPRCCGHILQLLGSPQFMLDFQQKMPLALNSRCAHKSYKFIPCRKKQYTQMCLTCFEVYCVTLNSQLVGHDSDHFGEHPVMFNLGDGSIRCYKCAKYLDFSTNPDFMNIENMRVELRTKIETGNKKTLLEPLPEIISFPVIYLDKHRVQIYITGLEQQEAVQNYLNAIVDDKQQQQNDANNGKLVIGFSGGSMPQLIAPLLAQLPEEISKRLYLFPVDERLVPLESAESNAGTLIRLLSNYSKNKISLDNVLRLPDELAADANKSIHAAQQFEGQLRALEPETDGHGFPMFDLLLLGLGPDGHTCSLFPGHPLLDDTSVWVSHLDDSPKPPPRRITLTLPVLNAACRLAFIANGAAKADVIKQIVADNSQRLPPSRIELHPPTSAGTSGEEQQRHIEWFLDAQAATKLTEAKVI